MQSPILSPAQRGPLGQYLWDLRKAANMTLRDVEEASERSVSNAYLSQLETGRVKSPSPAVLRQLASVYESHLPRNAAVTCSYDRMMELAGHGRHGDQAPPRGSSRLPQFTGEELTPEEEDELLKYLAFIRMRSGKK